MLYVHFLSTIETAKSELGCEKSEVVLTAIIASQMGDLLYLVSRFVPKENGIFRGGGLG